MQGLGFDATSSLSDAGPKSSMQSSTEPQVPVRACGSQLTLKDPITLQTLNEALDS